MMSLKTIVCSLAVVAMIFFVSGVAQAAPMYNRRVWP